MSRRKKIDPNIDPETGRGWGIDETGHCTENASPVTFFMGKMMAAYCLFIVIGFGFMAIEQLTFATTGRDFGFTESIGTWQDGR